MTSDKTINDAVEQEIKNKEQPLDPDLQNIKNEPTPTADPTKVSSVDDAARIVQEEIKHMEKTYKDAETHTKDNTMSQIIRKRLVEAGDPYHANDPIYQHIQEGELDRLQQEVTAICEQLLKALVINVQKDHNTKETAQRMAKMYIRETLAGRFTPPPKITTFPNAKNLREILTSGPISIRSMCSHHFVPIMGKCWVGVVPGENVIGLSKFNRVVDWIATRPQIQEEMVIQIADALEQIMKPVGLAIVVKADHMCMHWRGVEDCGSMANACMRGIFAHNPYAKQEFYDIIKGQGYCTHG